MLICASEGWKFESCCPELVNFLQKFNDIATDESDSENLELDWDGESSDEVSAGEEVGDGYCSGNK